jgi:hypothetical protein
MRKILSEKNVAAILFVLVLVAFSFAHEDSKKRSHDYNASSIRVHPDHSSARLLTGGNNAGRNADVNQ